MSAVGRISAPHAWESVAVLRGRGVNMRGIPWIALADTLALGGCLLIPLHDVLPGPEDVDPPGKSTLPGEIITTDVT